MSIYNRNNNEMLRSKLIAEHRIVNDQLMKESLNEPLKTSKTIRDLISFVEKNQKNSSKQQQKRNLLERLQKTFQRFQRLFVILRNTKLLYWLDRL